MKSIEFSTSEESRDAEKMVCLQSLVFVQSNIFMLELILQGSCNMTHLSLFFVVILLKVDYPLKHFQHAALISLPSCCAVKCCHNKNSVPRYICGIEKVHILLEPNS